MAEFELHTYNSRDVNVSFAGRSIDTGRADGDFYTSSYKSELFTDKAGADGVVVRSKSNDFRAEIKLKLLKTSAGHKTLTELYALARASVNGSDVGALEVLDLSGGLVERADSAWISKPPDNVYGREVGEVEWTLTVANLIREVA